MKKFILLIVILYNSHLFAQNSIETCVGMNNAGQLIYQPTSSFLANYIVSSKSITTTSPLQGGGDLSTNRTLSILDAAADNATKGAAAFDSSYFISTSGVISFSVKYGTSPVVSNAVTINRPRGRITVTPNIAAGGTVSITFTNSFINATSTINLQVNGSGNNLNVPIQAYVRSQTSGSCVINMVNISLLTIFNTGIYLEYYIVN